MIEEGGARRSSAGKAFVLAVLVLLGAIAAFVVGVGEGAVQAAVRYLAALFQVGLSLDGARADRPVDDGTERDADERSPGPIGPDPAVPDYLHRYALPDLRLARELAWKHLKAISRTTFDLIGSTDPDPWSWVICTFLVGRVLGLALGLVFVVVPLAAVNHGVVVVMSGLWRALGLLLRFLDWLLLRGIRNARMFCLSCFRPMPYPAYRCPGCGETHWDVRPGRFGILYRVCLCGRRFPTLLMTGAAKMQARCAIPSCGADLPHSPGTTRTLLLPIFGATAAGKTRLTYALLAALQEHPGVQVSTADRPTAVRLENLYDELTADSSTEPTQLALEQGLVVRLKIRRRTLLLHFFDTAGERFNTRQGSEEHDFVRHARTFTMVVNPLSVPGFWELQPEEEANRLRKEANPSRVSDPERVFHQAVEGIEGVGGDLRKARLALVLSRADQIRSADDDVEEWMNKMKLDKLVFAARDGFGKEVRIFHTAAVAVDGAVDESVQYLLRWLMPGLVRIASQPGSTSRSDEVT